MTAKKISDTISLRITIVSVLATVYHQITSLNIACKLVINTACHKEGVNMKNVLLLGSGKIGAIITELLTSCGDYHVTVAE